MSDENNPTDQVDAGMHYVGGIDVGEHMPLSGVFHVEMRNAHGELKWSEVIENTVVTVGKNQALDAFLTTTTYTAVGPFMGLVSGAAAVTVAAGDTMASHTGWTESGLANAPTYTAPRKTLAFSVAGSSSKASTGTFTYVMTGAGTIAGCFVVLGSGATTTIDNTGGILYSAGTFTGGSKIVASSDSLTVTYTANM